MRTTFAPSESIVDQEFTQGSTNESEKASHVLNILTYQKNSRINYLKEQSEIALDDSKNEQRDFLIPAIRKQRVVSYRNSFSKVQTWIGYVTAVQAGSFFARIEDTRLQGTYEEAEFDLEEVEEEDKTLLSIGSIFYWSIGYEYRGGTKSKQSVLRFKRLPKLNASDIDSAANLRDELFDNLNWY